MFSVHDGRHGCAPPLSIRVRSNGKIYLEGDYKTGPGERCRRDVLKTKYLGNQRIKRDGTEQKFRVDLDFNGKGAFGIEVYINNALTAKSNYKFEEGKGYIKSKKFFFKHGVYSRHMFAFQATAKFKMRKSR